MIQKQYKKDQIRQHIICRILDIENIETMEIRRIFKNIYEIHGDKDQKQRVYIKMKIKKRNICFFISRYAEPVLGLHSDTLSDIDSLDDFCIEIVKKLKENI